uniref:Uncharacterized protein n=1 Tax=Podoviridae sp. ctc5632 TaxID=2826565 RepID=A0A8S5LV88_9CAUD|nr:MAG TPA: hypothetical protein [Podoviridae sp. ctc5632]
MYFSMASRRRKPATLSPASVGTGIFRACPASLSPNCRAGGASRPVRSATSTATCLRLPLLPPGLFMPCRAENG